MDNTLKLLISVLSIAGLIALFTPTAPEDASPAPAAVQAAAQAMPDKVGEPETVPVAEDESEDDDLLAGFGEPMNDGNPIDPLKDDEADTSDNENRGQPTNDTTPQFSPPSDAPAATGASSTVVTAPAPAKPPAPASNAVADGKPIPGAPKVSRVPQT